MSKKFVNVSAKMKKLPKSWKKQRKEVIRKEDEEDKKYRRRIVK